MEKQSIVKVDGLRKDYGEYTAVDGISFDVQQGEIFGLLGPNGAGKTTTLESLEGLREPSSSTATVQNSSDTKARISFSLSTMILRAMDCTRPAESGPPIFLCSTGLIL